MIPSRELDDSNPDRKEIADVTSPARRELLKVFLKMLRRKRTTSDFSEEIEAHIQLEIDRLREQGLSEEAAQAAAYRKFGSARRATRVDPMVALRCE